jgi:hypothetical protein
MATNMINGKIDKSKWKIAQKYIFKQKDTKILFYLLFLFKI